MSQDDRLDSALAEASELAQRLRTALEASDATPDTLELQFGIQRGPDGDWGVAPTAAEGTYGVTLAYARGAPAWSWKRVRSGSISLGRAGGLAAAVLVFWQFVLQLAGMAHMEADVDAEAATVAVVGGLGGFVFSAAAAGVAARRQMGLAGGPLAALVSAWTLGSATLFWVAERFGDEDGLIGAGVACAILSLSVVPWLARAEPQRARPAQAWLLLPLLPVLAGVYQMTESLSLSGGPLIVVAAWLLARRHGATAAAVVAVGAPVLVTSYYLTDRLSFVFWPWHVYALLAALFVARPAWIESWVRACTRSWAAAFSATLLLRASIGLDTEQVGLSLDPSLLLPAGFLLLGTLFAGENERIGRTVTAFLASTVVLTLLEQLAPERYLGVGSDVVWAAFAPSEIAELIACLLALLAGAALSAEFGGRLADGARRLFRNPFALTAITLASLVSISFSFWLGGEPQSVQLLSKHSIPALLPLTAFLAGRYRKGMGVALVTGMALLTAFAIPPLFSWLDAGAAASIDESVTNPASWQLEPRRRELDLGMPIWTTLFGLLGRRSAGRTTSS